MAAAAPAASPAADVLSRRCLSCHSHEKKTAGIDLSTLAGAKAAGAARIEKAVVSGKMPPIGKLPASEVATVRDWVKAGTPYAKEPLEAMKVSDQSLWSLQPIRRPAVPHTPYDALARNPIDRFIFAKLAENGLKPSKPANPLALIRRATMDLTGLPPTPEEVDAFLADKRPGAYERLVDRLLASPAYGERWGRHWLDVVRFGESNGYEQNYLRPNAWPYRDYVVKAFNHDKPYDRFVKEQLAGDVLANGDPTVEAATGFLVAGIHDTVGNQTEEGTRQQRANDLDDIVASTSETFLALTAGCAKCHDHKFDPIPQKDYYRLAAVFAGVRHGERRLSGANQKRDEVDSLTRDLRSALGDISDLDVEGRAAVLRAQGVNPVPRPSVNAKRNVEDFAPVRAKFVRFTVTATKDGNQPCLDELELYGADRTKNLALGAKATASSLLPGFAIHQVAHLNDGRYGNDWSWISNEPGRGWAQIELAEPAEISRVVWSRDSSPNPRLADRIPSVYRVEVSVDGREWKTVATEAGRAAGMEAISGDKLQAAMTAEQRDHRKQLQAKADALRQKLAGLAGMESAYIGNFTAPDPVFVLKRGDVMQRQEEVTPAALSRIPEIGPELLPPDKMRSEAERRLGFANWLTDPRNPLTARVMVNRLWHGHFGKGIVPTPSDFGHNGEAPSHPELLDWLASDFMANGWKMKRLHRMIVTSYTYCESSAADPKGLAVDASDRLLWRAPLQRVEAEALRDAILATSGKLDRRMGGPGYLLYKYRVVNVAIYEPLEEYSPETWRRSVYAQAARGIREDLLGTFDCPESSQRIPRRPSTTTALQALSLLNGPFAVQQSEFFADRVRKEAGAEAGKQVDRAFKLAFGRAPRAEERKPALEVVTQLGLPSLCRGLLNANEFLYY